MDGYKTRFGPLNAQLADALQFLLRKIEADTRFVIDPTDRYQLAYCLATFKWETAHTLQPIDEYGSDAYFEKRYGPNTKAGKQLGNTDIGDGALFHGRGYVQLTGRANYKRVGDYFKVDLITEPDIAKSPDIAYNIAIEGLKQGWFTSKRLGQFFRDGEPPNYENARKIINGLDKAQIIADIARRFDELLVVSLER